MPITSFPIPEIDLRTATDEQLTEIRELLGFWIPRVTSVVYAATVTPNADTTDVLNIGALINNITIANPSGTPSDGQRLFLRLSQDTTGGRTITWGDAYDFGTDVTEVLIPSTASAKWRMVFQWCAATSKWEAVGIARGF